MGEQLQNLLGRLSRMNRRTFLKLSGAGAAAATVGGGLGTVFNAVAQQPSAQEPEQWIATSCMSCVGWCPKLVKVEKGRAVSIKGNPASKVTNGELCPRGPLGLQILYDPDRVKTPMKRTNPKKGINEDPKFVPITWEEAWKELTARLNKLRQEGAPEKLVMLRGRYTEASATYWYGTFAKAFGTPNSFSHSALCAESTKIAEWMGDGRFGYSSYDMENMRYMLAFGCSPVEAHRPTTRMIHGWAAMRSRPDRAKIVVVDPRMSVSAAKADEWLPVNPGTDGALAVAIAHVILTQGLWDKKFVGDFADGKNLFVRGQDVPEEAFKEVWTAGLVKWWNTVVKDFTPEYAAKETGIDAATITRIAKEFATLKPATAWRARGADAWPGGGYAGYAIFSLNALVGSLHQVGGVFNDSVPKYWTPKDPELDAVAAAGTKKKKLDDRGSTRFLQAAVVTNNIADNIIAGKPYPVEVVIAHHSNFAFSAPNTERWWKAFEKVWLVHLTTNISETTLFADLVLPAATYLETWAFDKAAASTLYGEIQIKQPVVKPLYEGISTEQFAFELAKRLGGPVAQEMAKIAKDSEDYVRRAVEPLMPFDQFKKVGVITTGPVKLGNPEGKFNTESKKYEFVSSNLKKTLETKKVSPDDLKKVIGVQAEGDAVLMPHYEKPRFIGAKEEFPLVLISYKTIMNCEGRSGNSTWNQELFQVMYNEGWTNFAEINPATAAKLGVKDGDEVIVESKAGQLKAKAKVTPTVHPEICAMAFGQGHRAYGRWANGRGANPNDITGVDYEYFSGMSAYYNTRVRIKKA